MSKRQSQAREDGEVGAPDPAIFDREHLNQYTSGERELERELLALFMGQFAPIRSQLDAAQSAHDWKFASHSLKGSARSIGAPRIATLAEQLEILGFEAPDPIRAGVLDQLDAAMAAFADEIKKIVD